MVHLARIRLCQFPMFRLLSFSATSYICVCLFEWFASTSILPMTPDWSPVSCFLLIFRCNCTLNSGGCSILIIVLVCSVISLLLGLFCGRFLVFSATIPLYFINSSLSSAITHRRLWFILGSVTCVPFLLFVVKCHSW